MLTFSELSIALKKSPIVPVLTVETVAQAAPLAAALSAGGLGVLEVTLRTDAALDVITEMRNAAPNLIIGAGTVLTAADVEATLKAGAQFLVSPGMTDKLHAAVSASQAVMLPGITTPSEAMARHEQGYECLKLFPAEAVGGRALLKAMSGPLEHIKFMPTGGINASNAADYLIRPNVIAIGGGWLAPLSDLEAGNWQAIETRARAAMSLVE